MTKEKMNELIEATYSTYTGACSNVFEKMNEKEVASWVEEATLCVYSSDNAEDYGDLLNDEERKVVEDAAKEIGKCHYRTA